MTLNSVQTRNCKYCVIKSINPNVYSCLFAPNMFFGALDKIFSVVYKHFNDQCFITMYSAKTVQQPYLSSM